MEPLRRPQEKRRVPPLRIRLPKRREVRKRIPARLRDYSPPGRATRPRFSRASATLHQELLSTDNNTTNTRRSRRSRKLLSANDTSIR
uniref:Uncharacterized protein n=1 Tax=Syphacia muris TaxID=451379 RepID=A0A0N5B0D6_9BILA